VLRETPGTAAASPRSVLTRPPVFRMPVRAFATAAGYVANAIFDLACLGKR
jgi:hypothetical protein